LRWPFYRCNKIISSKSRNLYDIWEKSVFFSIFEGNVCLVCKFWVKRKKWCTFFHFWGQKVGISNSWDLKSVRFFPFSKKKFVCFFAFWEKKMRLLFEIVGKNVPAFSNFGWKSLPTFSYFGRKKYLNFPVLKKKMHCLISPILSDKKNIWCF